MWRSELRECSQMSTAMNAVKAGALKNVAEGQKCERFIDGEFP
jgi:hypothetical protein